MISPALAIQQALFEIEKMAQLVLETIEDSKDYILNVAADRKLEKKIDKYEQITDNIQKEIMIFMSEVMKHPLTTEETHQVTSILRLADELETITDYAQNLKNYGKRFFDNEVVLDSETKAELEQLSLEVYNFYKFVFDSLSKEGQVELNTYESQAVEINRLADEMKGHFLKRIMDGRYPPLGQFNYQ